MKPAIVILVLVVASLLGGWWLYESSRPPGPPASVPPAEPPPARPVTASSGPAAQDGTPHPTHQAGGPLEPAPRRQTPSSQPSWHGRPEVLPRPSRPEDRRPAWSPGAATRPATAPDERDAGASQVAIAPTQPAAANGPDGAQEDLGAMLEQRTVQVQSMQELAASVAKLKSQESEIRAEIETYTRFVEESSQPAPPGRPAPPPLEVAQGRLRELKQDLDKVQSSLRDLETQLVQATMAMDDLDHQIDSLRASTAPAASAQTASAPAVTPATQLPTAPTSQP